MQTTTPTPPTRNRRAGRMSALPPQTPPPAAQPEQTPAPQHCPVPANAVPPQPEAPRPAPPAAPLQPLHGVQQPSAPRASYRQPLPEQPASRPAAPQPPALHSVPAAARPSPDMHRPPYNDDPRLRRIASRPRPAPQERPTPRAKATRPTPAWLKTALTLVFLGVLALGTLSLVIMADLKTTEKARQQAWSGLLNNFHITQDETGALRVTWQELIEHYAGMYNLDPAFVTAIIRNESSFRTTAVSSVGARGLMQMMPDTAQWIADKLNEPFDFDNLFDAETSIRYGCWYLNYLADLFYGDTVLVCAAYHAGQGEVLSWLGDDAISPDGVCVPISRIPISNTRTYAERVTYAYGVYEKLLYPSGDANPVPVAHSPALYGDAAVR